MLYYIKKIPILINLGMGNVHYKKEFLIYPPKGKVGWKNGQKFILWATKGVALLSELYKETTLYLKHQYRKVLVFAPIFLKLFNFL